MTSSTPPATYPPAKHESRTVVAIRVDATNYGDATDWVIERASRGSNSYVCVANVHMTMEAYDSPAFSRTVDGADLVVPDGMPLVWALKLLGVREASRVRGPSLTLDVARAAAEADIGVAVYGGKPEVAESFAKTLVRHAPKLEISAVISPPFRELSPEEEAEIAARIKESGARIIFVGLGCPKQEKWMARNVGRIDGVMLGVGAAFDFHAGNVREAPIWMQEAGLEWLFRLAQEPARLLGRYARHNPRFIALLIKQVVTRWLGLGAHFR